MGRWVLGLVGLALVGGCGRSQTYRPKRIPVVGLSCDPRMLTRPCATICGSGIEKCIGGYWTACSAADPLSAPATLELTGTLRDFHPSHPDFENRVGDDHGIVETMLGSDDKPVYAHGGSTRTVTSPVSFFQWYHDTPGINRSAPLSLTLNRTSLTPLVYSFVNNAFFPLDGQLFGDEGNNHNFHFTLELHTEVEYRGGETLSFQGDDDLLIFVAGSLVIDLGGAHPTEAATVSLDSLGLATGTIYPLDVFFAERHTSSSTLRVETTNARFVQCP